MSTAEYETFKALRSERRWAIVEKAAKGFCALCAAVIAIGLISASTLVFGVWGPSDDRGVMDGDQ